MRVKIAIGSVVLIPNTAVVIALLHSPDSKIGFRPILCTSNHNRSTQLNKTLITFDTCR
jgi:hypothetical protein